MAIKFLEGVEIDGNVGIGTTNPDAILHVESTGATGANFILETTHSGGIPLLDLKGAHSAQLRYKDELDAIQGRIDFGDSGTFNFIDVPNNKSTLYLKTGGNVGIGTTSPSYNLVVGDGTTDTESRFYHNDASYTSVRGYGLFMSRTSSYIRPVTTNTQNLYVGHTSNVWNAISNNANNHIFSTGASERMRITAAGNVGIGTTSPSAKLDVNGELRASLFRDRDNTNYYINPSGGTSAILAGNVGIGTTSPSYKLDVAGDVQIQSAYFLRFANEWGIQQTGTNLNFAEIGSAEGRLYLKAGGNVGIGTTSPTRELEVQGAGNVYIKVAASTDNDSSAIELQNTQETWTIRNSDSNDDALQFESDTLTAMTIRKSGNVGIGTTSPGSKLDVSDRVHIDTYSSEASGSNPVTSGLLRIRAGSKTGWGVDDQLGKLEFYGTDTSGIGARTAASIIAVCETGNGTSTTTFSSGLAFYTSPYNAAQEERMRIDPSGATSFIGSSSLSTAVASIQHYSSNGYLYIKGGAGGLILGDDSTASRIQIEDNSNIRFETAGSEAMRITSAGNVGIGTTSPSYQLTLGGNAVGSTEGLRINDPSNAAYGAHFSFSDTPNEVWIGGVTNNTYNSTIGIHREATRTITVDITNNVGIGTTSPSEKLSISGAKNTPIIHLGSTTNSSSWSIGDKIGAIEFGSADSSGAGVGVKASISYEVEAGATGATNSMVFRSAGTAAGTNNTERMRITASGNVGIGTASPLRKLHVVGNFAVNAAAGEYYGVNISGGEGANPNIFIGDWHNSSANLTWDSVNNFLRIDSQHSTSGAPIVFSGNDAATEYARFTATGNVGIGTTNPGAKLDVEGDVFINSNYNGSNVAANDLTIGKTTTGDHGITIVTGPTYEGSIYFGDSDNNDAGIIGYQHSTNSMKFTTNRSEQLRITSAGNVGIGTTSPGAKLDVVASYVNATPNTESSAVFRRNGNNYLTILTGSTNQGGILFGNAADTNDGSISYTHSTQSMAFATADTERMRITSAGNVGIGTTSPGAKLHIGSPEVTPAGTAGTVDRLAIQPYSNTGGPYIFKARTVSGSEDYLDLYYNTNQLMSVGLNGNVGIGTTNPGAKLQVDAGSNIASFRSVGSGQNNKELLIQTGGDRVVLDAKNASDGTAASLAFELGNSEKARLTTTGLGIGTTSPDAPLTVTNNTVSSYILNVNMADGVDGGGLYEATGGMELYLKDTSGTGQVKLTSSGISYLNGGNVGIGTTNPDQKLSIDNGYILIKDNAYDTYFLSKTRSDGSQLVGFQSHSVGALSIHSNNVERMRIDASGNVGIGTTSPNQKLQVSGPSGAAISILTPWAAGAYGQLRFDTGTGNSSIRSSVPGNSTNGLDFYTYSSATSETVKMSILGNGNVGIGTNNPSKNLDVVGTGETTIRVADTGGAYLQMYQQSTDSYIMSANSMRFYTNGSQRAVITNSGNVGIGTTSPAYTLDVNGGFHSSNITIADGIYHEGDTNNYFQFATDTQIFATAGSERMRITSAGNVGIGTTSPNQKLHINDGGIRVEKYGTGLGGFVSVGNATEAAGNYSAYFFGNTASDTNYFKGGIAYETLASTYGRGDMHFLQNSTTSVGIASISDSVMTILNGGNVGIGTTSPGTKLQVDGVIRSKGTSANIDVDSLYGAFRFNNGTTFTGGFYNDAVLSSGNAVDLVTYIASGDYYISTTSTSKAVTVKQGGNVGINNTNPSAKLDVVGTMSVDGDSTFQQFIKAPNMQNYANNNDAILGGLTPGTLYHTNGTVKIVI